MPKAPQNNSVFVPWVPDAEMTERQKQEYRHFIVMQQAYRMYDRLTWDLKMKEALCKAMVSTQGY